MTFTPDRQAFASARPLEDSAAVSPPRIGVLLKTYPKISETFILGEILGLEQLGLPLHILSLQRPTDSIAHDTNAAVRAPVSYVLAPSIRRSLQVLGEQARLLVSNPRRYLGTLAFALGRQESSRAKHFLQAGTLALAARKAGLDHIYAHFASEPAGVAELAQRLTGIGYSISAHAKDIYLSPPEVLRRKLASAAFAVTCTEYNRRHLAALAGDGKVHRMYHGIDVGRFSPAGTPRRSDPPLILSVGRLREKKGFPTLIEACALLARRGVRFQCRIVGYGPDADMLTALIEAKGLTQTVVLAGKLAHEQLIELYRAATLFALPCRIGDDGDRDGIPNVLLEAMATELPVVSTHISGIPELVEHDRNGLLVPPDDPAALADAMSRLILDKDLGARLGQAGRVVVAQRFSNAANLALLRSLLLQATGRAPRIGAPSIGSLPASHTHEIAYILKGYPRLSETFIANEIHLLEQMGLSLRLYSVKAGERTKVHGVVRRIRAPVNYLPEVGSISACSLPRWLKDNFGAFAGAHAGVLRRRPLGYLRALGSALAMSWRYRNGSLLKPRKVFIKEFVQAGAIAADLLENPGVRHLHGHFCHGATTITWYVSRMTGLPFSFTAHAKDIYQKKLNPGDLLRRKLKAASFVATCTGANHAHLKEVCPDCQVVHTIYHGLDTDCFAPPHDKQACDRPPLVLAVGRFVEKKGFAFLVEACAQLRSEGLSFTCMIVGEKDGDYDRITKMIAEAGLQDVVALKGAVSQEELREIYAGADLFVLPCQVMDDGDRDGIPNVLAEAMAMGIPVVSTAISGIPELVENGRDGLLVPERNSAALAHAMRQLLQSPQRRAELGDRARARICDVFDSHKTTLRLKELFVRAIAEQEART